MFGGDQRAPPCVQELATLSACWRGPGQEVQCLTSKRGAEGGSFGERQCWSRVGRNGWDQGGES